MPISPRSPSRRARVFAARSIRLSARRSATRWRPRSGARCGCSLRPFAAITGRLAAAGGVEDPEIRWRLREGPCFDNQVATLKLDGRRASMKLEKVPHDTGPPRRAPRIRLRAPAEAEARLGAASPELQAFVQRHAGCRRSRLMASPQTVPIQGRVVEDTTPAPGRYLPHAVAATATVTLAPAVPVWGLAVTGMVTGFIPLLAVGLVVSLLVAYGGRVLWEMRPGSRDLLFSDLMLWGWLRRWRLERDLGDAVALLGTRHEGCLPSGSDELDPAGADQGFEEARQRAGSARSVHARALPSSGPVLDDDRQEARPPGGRCGQDPSCSHGSRRRQARGSAGASSTSLAS